MQEETRHHAGHPSRGRIRGLVGYGLIRYIVVKDDRLVRKGLPVSCVILSVFGKVFGNVLVGRKMMKTIWRKLSKEKPRSVDGKNSVIWLWHDAGLVTTGDWYRGKARDAARNYEVITGIQPTHWTYCDDVIPINL